MPKYKSETEIIMKSVFVLQHVHAFGDDDEDVKFIGVYSSHEKAERAISRLIQKQGFKDKIDGFHIDQYEIDLDYWIEGYVTTTHV